MKGFFYKLMVLVACILLTACSAGTPAERAAGALARRIMPQYDIRFIQTGDSLETYSFYTDDSQLVIKGSSTSAMAAGLNRYLSDWCKTDVSWYADDPVQAPSDQPVVDNIVTGKALVKERFFLNYCTFGYTMPWWQWKDWERLIDWMALNGVNLPLAITGQESVWQELWRRHGLSDEEILSWFTGPAYLPWHRMCNIDGFDGPLPQGWIDAQETLQKQILSRERELGMTPVLPAFGGHVPAVLKEKYPKAKVTKVSAWGGFPKENLPYFLSPTDSLFAVIQKEFIEIQTEKYGTGHIYGFDLFNEVAPPSWEPDTLAAIGRCAFESLAAADSEARWLQMGWLFYYDRKHWTPEAVKAYLEAIPKGRLTMLDYYTENIPVWTLTEGFHGHHYIFCYLGNFGGNTRLAGPFRKESTRITEALAEGGAAGLGCTLEGFGINKWFYEYVLSRAWNTGVSDDEWLSSLDGRRHSPSGFWKTMADSIYVRGSFSEGALLCGRPCLDGFRHWTVIHNTPYDNSVLERAYEKLLQEPSDSRAWNYDRVAIGLQVKGNRFALLRDDFTSAYRKGDLPAARSIGAKMKSLIMQIDSLAGEEPSFRLDRWLQSAAAFASVPEEEDYYMNDAWRILTTWGSAPNLNDYASRLWNGLVAHYYAPRWTMFIDEVISCMEQGRQFDQTAFDRECRAFEESVPDYKSLTVNSLASME
ncbi:MAG: alpha-N-acetylglucosaminidase [Bacteroidales bacterium]|nr:alpha-N-acetylglucosaminidase [Bacteroidales bacterium]